MGARESAQGVAIGAGRFRKIDAPLPPFPGSLALGLKSGGPVRPPPIRLSEHDRL